jgi:hypothetical protein
VVQYFLSLISVTDVCIHIKSFRLELTLQTLEVFLCLLTTFTSASVDPLRERYGRGNLQKANSCSQIGCQSFNFRKNIFRRNPIRQEESENPVILPILSPPD